MSEESGSEHKGIIHLFADEPIGTSPDHDHLFDTLDQRIWEQIAELSKKSPDFKILTDDLLRRTSELPEEERKGYVEEAYGFYLTVTAYRDPYFLRNFFGYLFDKTRNKIEDETRSKFVFIAKSVYDSVLNALNEKTGRKQNPDYLLSLIRPGRNLVEDFRFNKRDYEAVKKSLHRRIKNYVMEENDIISEEFDKDFYRKETVAEIIEMVAEKAGVLNSN